MKKLKKGLLVIASVAMLATVAVAPVHYHNSNSPSVGEKVGALQAKKIKKATMQTTANLNMRNQASTKGKVLVTIPKGTKVTTDTKVGSWYKVSYKGKTGYVSGSYLKVANAPTKATPKKATPKKVAPKKVTPKKPAPVKEQKVAKKTYQTTAGLNMRTLPSTQGKVLVTIPKNTKVDSNVRSNGWYKVSYKGKTGWVSGSYLKVYTKPAPKPKPKAVPKASASKWMNQNEAIAIWSKTMTRNSSTSYGLKAYGEEWVSVGFQNRSDAKADLVVDSVRYISAVEVKPNDFGRKDYNAYKDLLNKMNASIQGYSDSQLGKGTREANQLTADTKNFIMKSKNGESVRKTYNGKTFVLSDMGGVHKVSSN